MKIHVYNWMYVLFATWFPEREISPTVHSVVSSVGVFLFIKMMTDLPELVGNNTVWLYIFESLLRVIVTTKFVEKSM